jgi:hypothetical protein
MPCRCFRIVSAAAWLAAERLLLAALVLAPLAVRDEQRAGDWSAVPQ